MHHTQDEKNITIKKTPMHTPRLSEAAVAFPRGLRVDLGIHTLFFISGTASVGPEGQSMHEGDFYAQVIHTYKNIASLLHEQSAAFKDIVRFTVYLKSMDYYDKFNKARDDFFANQGLSREEFPASTCVEARLCREELLVEIEAIAIIK